MSAAEAMPLDVKTGLMQRIAKPLCSDMRKNVVLHAMALKNRQTFPFLHKWGPDFLGQ